MARNYALEPEELARGLAMAGAMAMRGISPAPATGEFVNTSTSCPRA